MKHYLLFLFLWVFYQSPAQDTITVFDPLENIYQEAQIMHDGRYELEDSESNLLIKYRFKDQMLHGKYLSYINGKKNAKGRYKEGKRIGKWKLFNEKNKRKLLRSYEDFDYTTKMLRLPKGEKVIRWGKGSFECGLYYFSYAYPLLDTSYFEEALKSTQQYSKGKKTGKWTEKTNNGRLLYEASFSEGKYHGSVMHYDKNGELIEKKSFSFAKPIDIWEIKENDEWYISDYRNKELKDKPIDLYYPTKNEIISNYPCFSVYFGEDLNFFQFYYQEDSLVDFFNMLEILYQNNAISAYDDPLLEKEYILNHQQMFLHGFSFSEKVKFRPYALILSENYIFEKQYNTMLPQILSFSVVLQYQIKGSDSVAYKLSPWFYYPELQKAMMAISMENKTNLHSLLYEKKLPSYLYLKKSTKYSEKAYLDPVFLIKSAVNDNKENRLLLIENEHFWWYPYVKIKAE